MFYKQILEGITWDDMSDTLIYMIYIEKAITNEILIFK